MSVASMIPSLYFKPRTDVPVTIGCEVCEEGSEADEAEVEANDGDPMLANDCAGVDDHVWPG